jgi:hypothetical protein
MSFSIPARARRIMIAVPEKSRPRISGKFACLYRRRALSRRLR